MSNITTNPRRDPKIKWNDASFKAWIHTNHDAEEFKGVDFNRNVVIRFMQRIDLNNGPLKQTIQTIVRVVSNQYDDDGEIISNKKQEYVYYVIDYSGKDSWKQRINSGSIIEGKHSIIPQYQEVKWKLEGGTPIEQLVTKDDPPIIKYTIPFSKKAVDEIIKKHGNEDRRDDIKYCVFFEGRDREYYSYDQFVNSEYEHCRYLHNRQGGPKLDFTVSKIDPSKVNLPCNCNECQKVKHKNG